MTATPFLYWFIGLLAIGDYETDLMVWHTLSLVLMVTAVLLLCRLMGYPPAASLALLLPLLVWFDPLHSDLRVGNVNCFQLGMLGLIMLLLGRDSENRFVFAAANCTNKIPAIAS